MNGKIIIENSKFSLVIDEACRAESLVFKATGEQLLASERLPLFSVTQERPFNNEIKLIYMNKRTTYPANRVRQEGNRLIVGFELAPYEAIVEYKITDSYVAFTFSDFIVKEGDYNSFLKMNTPPAVEFRILNLPIKKRENYGKWLNVVWDSECAVDLLATTPHARIDSEEREGCRILTADAVKGIKLRGCTAALIVSKTEELLDNIDALEHDYNMPLGVESRRRSDVINSSIYWTNSITPENVDEHIKYAKAGGFRLMLVYYRPLFHEEVMDYLYCGDYEYNEHFPEGKESVRKMLERIKAAGITPGLHFLHSHIGVLSKYVTPHADHRLNTTAKFTLAKPLGISDDVIYVCEDTTDTTTFPDCRYLKFGTELISYEGYSTEYPYHFYGCKRGAYDTEIISHPAGERGGVLDLSEFGAHSVYLDQNTDLQDEIADKLADLYDAGFEFVYFDGSEGTNPPFEYHVPNAQYRVYKKLSRAPLFCEGAAKAHFSWHMLSGANAFDIFETDIFKPMIDKFPVVAAKEMRNDFTRVNFGWWKLFRDTRPDVYEYGMSRAVGWNCPATMISEIDDTRVAPLRDDTLEAIRRWEDAKHEGFFTEQMKKRIREDGKEYTLFKDERGEWELRETVEIKTEKEKLYAFAFSRGDDTYVSLCYVGDEIKLALSADAIEYLSDVCGDAVPFDRKGAKVILPVSHRRYIKTKMSLDNIARVIAESEII